MKIQGRPTSTNVVWGNQPVVRDKSRKEKSVENSNLRTQSTPAPGDGVNVPPKPGPYQSTYDTINPKPIANQSIPLTAPNPDISDLY